MDTDRMVTLLQELIEKADQPEDLGFITIREMAFSQGRLDILHSQRRKLAMLVAEGKVEMKMVSRTSITGVRYECPGYRVSEADSL